MGPTCVWTAAPSSSNGARHAISPRYNPSRGLTAKPLAIRRTPSPEPAMNDVDEPPHFPIKRRTAVLLSAAITGVVCVILGGLALNAADEKASREKALLRRELEDARKRARETEQRLEARQQMLLDASQAEIERFKQALEEERRKNQGDVPFPDQDDVARPLWHEPGSGKPAPTPQDEAARPPATR